MQFSTILAMLATAAQAHWSFPQLIVDGVVDPSIWSTVRPTKESSEGNPERDITSYNFRCNQAGPGNSNRTVSAGSTLGFKVEAVITHNGPTQFYMAKMPDGHDLNTWEAEGNVWFKVGSLVATGPDPVGMRWGDNEALWPSLRQTQVSFKVPKNIPNGYYLVRVETIATDRDSQYYLACGQVMITGGGNGTPGPLVAFPGAYKLGDPSLTYGQAYDPNWKAPGPPIWTG